MKRRVTPQKKAILDLFKNSKTALNLEQIEENLSSKMDKATIYRNLKNFHEDGLIHKITCKNGSSYYALDNENTNKNNYHFHFYCENCKKMICLKESINFNLPDNFSYNDCNSVINGTCPNCK